MQSNHHEAREETLKDIRKTNQYQDQDKQNNTQGLHA